MKKQLTILCTVLLVFALLLPAFSMLSFADEKTLTTDKNEYTVGEPIMVTATGDGNDWVGLYKKGEKAGSTNDGGIPSIYWYYVAKNGNTSGTAKNIYDAEEKPSERADMRPLPAGEYVIFLLENDGYNVLAQVDITVKEAPVPVEKTLKTDKTEYTEGEPIMITATGDKADWVGIYKKGETTNPSNGGANSIRWYYVAKDGVSSGDTVNIFDPDIVTVNDRPGLTSIPAGEYTIYLLENDGYNVLAQVDITVKEAPVPVEKTLKTDKTKYTEGDKIMITATGDKADWVGIYKKGEAVDPRAGGMNSIRWYYVALDGNISGEAKNIFDAEANDRPDVADLPAGEYTVYLFEDDGYTVLASVDITIEAKKVDPPKTGDISVMLVILTVASLASGAALLSFRRSRAHR